MKGRKVGIEGDLKPLSRALTYFAGRRSRVRQHVILLDPTAYY